LVTANSSIYELPADQYGNIVLTRTDATVQSIQAKLGFTGSHLTLVVYNNSGAADIALNIDTTDMQVLHYDGDALDYLEMASYDMVSQCFNSTTKWIEGDLYFVPT
jgi:hypothetical protein